MSSNISCLWRLEWQRRGERSQQWGGLKQLLVCIWGTCICHHAVQKHVLCPDKPDEEWAAVCHVSVTVGIDQSRIGSGDKVHEGEPTTAMPAQLPCKTQVDHSPTYMHKPSTLNQSCGVRRWACRCVFASSRGNRHVASYSHCVTMGNRRGRATEPLMRV